MSKTKFTATQDEIIIEEVQKCPNNLSRAFSECSKRMKYSEIEIKCRYKALVKHGVKMFVLMTPQGVVINIKNTVRHKTGKNLKLEIAEFAFSKLSKDEKALLLKLLTEETK